MRRAHIAENEIMALRLKAEKMMKHTEPGLEFLIELTCGISHNFIANS